MTRLHPLLLIVVLLMTLPGCSLEGDHAASVLPLEIGLMEDSSGLMAIGESADPGVSDRYRVERDNRTSLGFSRSALWVRIPLNRVPDEGDFTVTVAAPWMDRIDLYLPNPGGRWRRLSTGLLQPGPAPTVGGFVLCAPADTPREGYAYLRLESVLALNAGLELAPRKRHEHLCLIYSHVYGALYGLMGAMFLVNLIVFLTIRDRAYLYYILYLLSIIVHQFCLQGEILLLPYSFWPYVPHISLTFTGLSLFFGAALSRRFLDTPRNVPVFDKLLVAAQVLSIVLLALSLSGRLWWGTWLAHSIAVVGPIIAIGAGIRALGRGVKSARIYLLAWIVLLFGVMAWGAWSMGWLYRVRPPQMMITVAAALESVLLTLALADRLRLLMRERTALAQRERRYQRLSITDELTGLYNHRFFWSKLTGELEYAQQAGEPLSLIIVDLDDFKKLNDTCGHAAGDLVLAATGGLLRDRVRPADSACRYGGEEFGLILPGTNSQAALEVAERIRVALEKLEIDSDGCPVLRVTASFGVVEIETGDDAKGLFERADKALYKAKDGGKNRIEKN